jgi:hypothetical protein
VLLAAAVVVNKPSSSLLQLGRAQQLVAGFSQPGYDPKNPKDLLGHPVPPEFRDDDYHMIKSLAAVETDLKDDTALMRQVQDGLGIPAATMMRVAHGQQV